MEDSIVHLTVAESRIGEIRMVGNTYYSCCNILAKLPSLRPGALIHEPTLVKERDAINVNLDRKITPVLKPGAETGTVDVGNATIAGVRYFFPVFQGSDHTSDRAGRRLQTPPGRTRNRCRVEFDPLHDALTWIHWYPSRCMGHHPIFCHSERLLADHSQREKVDFAGDPSDPFNKPGNRAGSTRRFVIPQASLDRTQPCRWDLASRCTQMANRPANRSCRRNNISPAGWTQSGTISQTKRSATTRCAGERNSSPRCFRRFRSTASGSDERLLCLDHLESGRVLRRHQSLGTECVARAERSVPLGSHRRGVRAHAVPYNLQLQTDQGFALQDVPVTQTGATFVHYFYFMVSLAYTVVRTGRRFAARACGTTGRCSGRYHPVRHREREGEVLRLCRFVDRGDPATLCAAPALPDNLDYAVFCELVLDEEGHVLEYRLVNSSGSLLFDQPALDALSKLKQVRPPPPGAERTIVVKFVHPAEGVFGSSPSRPAGFPLFSGAKLMTLLLRTSRISRSARRLSR